MNQNANRLAVRARIWSYTAGVNSKRLITTRLYSSVLVAVVATSLAGAAHADPNDGQQGPPPDRAKSTRAPGDFADAPEQTEAPPTSPLERAREGVVSLERHGKVIGVGTVLSGDGRILTALSPLTHGNNIDARYADGSVSRVKVGHSDRAWDLALLIPQNGRWRKGLKASPMSPEEAGTALRVFTQHGKQLSLARTIIKGKATLLGGDSELLRDAVQLTGTFKGSDMGTPIIDNTGQVVAVVAKACSPIPDSHSCTRVPFGVPVSAVKAFLRTVPANAVPPAPWLGIQGLADQVGPVKGVRVLGVHPKSPAAAAGLQASSDKQKSDMVVAVDGSPVTTPEELAATINQRGVGESVQLLLYGSGKFREVTLTLRAAPNTPPAKVSMPVNVRGPRRTR